MRLVTYSNGSTAGAGIQRDGEVIDAAAAAAHAGVSVDRETGPVSVRSLLELGPQALVALEASAAKLQGYGVDAAAVTLGPPVADPDKIVCLGLNYRDHAREAGMDQPPEPVLFAKYRNSLIGPEAPIVMPSACKAVDYEGELAVVIGQTAKGVNETEALRCVAGYMAFNDVSDREMQLRTPQWTAGKAIDSFGPCGPALVTADEVPDPQRLSLCTRLNGQLVQDGYTGDMIFTVARVVAFLTSFMTLVPGDIIVTGTPAGVGFTRVPPLHLAEGDLVEVEIEGIGALSNPVIRADYGGANQATPSREALA